jgi:branched-chain amino acid transport system substrate-binding protein
MASTALINPDFVRVAGASGNGALMPTGPVIVAEQLPDTYPTKKIALDFRAASRRSTTRRPPTPSRPIRSTAGWCSPTPPRALQKAEPGTPRSACAARRDLQHQGSGRHARRLQLQAGQLYGVDERARVIVKLDNGQWKLALSRAR